MIGVDPAAPYVARRVPTHETRTLRGLDMHLTRWVAPGSSPCVFLHGWADTSDTFQFVIDALKEPRDVVAPDWRGFGRSAWQQGPYWFPDYLADLDALVDEYSPETPVTLVGHSLGGNVASLYAGVRPERVARFVNLEGLGLRSLGSDEAPARYRRWLDELKAPPRFARFDSLDRFAEVLMRRNPRLSASKAAFIARAWSRPEPTGGYEVSADPWHKVVNPVLYRRPEAEACWARITAPTLLVLGAQSEFRAALGSEGLEPYCRRVFPTAEVVTLADAGHMMHHDQPEAVAALIEGFLHRYALP